MIDGDTLGFTAKTLARFGLADSTEDVDRELFTEVFTHSSYANEYGEKSNERLELLGDSIVGFIVTEHLYDKYPDLDEGECSKLKAKAVSTESLAGCAEKLDLIDYLRLVSDAPRKNNPERLEANLFEAFTAGVYLSYGMEGARRMVLSLIAPSIKLRVLSKSVEDYKSALSELCQKNRATLEYRELYRSGPDHNPTFTYCAVVNGCVAGIGSGKTKSEAQSGAAEEAWKKFAHIPGDGNK